MPAILRIAIAVPLTQLFDYRAPMDILPALGVRVVVPFGPRKVVGIVVEHTDTSTLPSARLKPILQVLDEMPLLTTELLASLHFAANYYQHPLGEVLEAALPAALRTPRPLPSLGEPALALTANGHRALIDLKRRRGTRMDALLEALVPGPLTYPALNVSVPGWRSAARTLRTRGAIEALLLTSVRTAPSLALTGPPLNAEQQTAVAEVQKHQGRYAPFLLDGVTGSGKTEVYLSLVAQAIARGEQALVLVPEIALTPQTLRRFRERLGVPVAALHSGLADGERTRAWLAAARGEAAVILGTRSAIFVPLPKPGIIVVDEEHDSSYKQQEGFRYQARDLALVRARALKVPVLLGSATPSLESLANVESGRYCHLPLTLRAGGAKPPRAQVVDLRRQRLENGLAKETLRAIEITLARDEQVLIFKNRRGYAPVLICHDCGWSAQCKRCERPLTLHRQAGQLRCHHCGAEQSVPAACPVCHAPSLTPQGHGTERLEEALKARFPGTPLARIDRDTTRGRAAREKLLDGLAMEGAGILIGTQMLAKGHDLPNVTLVVVVGVDEGLYSVDFRAPERLGQLIVQVAGRAGRALKPGTVYLQTHHADHPLLNVLLSGGYRALAATLLEERRAASLPPYSHLALLRAEAKQLEPIQHFLTMAMNAAQNVPKITALGPMPAPMPIRAGTHHAQILVESIERMRLQMFLSGWLETLRADPSARRVRWSIDVDPGDLY